MALFRLATGMVGFLTGRRLAGSVCFAFTSFAYTLSACMHVSGRAYFFFFIFPLDFLF